MGVDAAHPFVEKRVLVGAEKLDEDGVESLGSAGSGSIAAYLRNGKTQTSTMLSASPPK